MECCAVHVYYLPGLTVSNLQKSEEECRPDSERMGQNERHRREMSLYVTPLAPCGAATGPLPCRYMSAE